MSKRNNHKNKIDKNPLNKEDHDGDRKTNNSSSSPTTPPPPPLLSPRGGMHDPDGDTVQSIDSCSSLAPSLSNSDLSAVSNTQENQQKMLLQKSGKKDVAVVETPFCSPDPPPRPRISSDAKDEDSKNCSTVCSRDASPQESNNNCLRPTSSTASNENNGNVNLVVDEKQGEGNCDGDEENEDDEEEIEEEEESDEEETEDSNSQDDENNNQEPEGYFYDTAHSHQNSHSSLSSENKSNSSNNNSPYFSPSHLNGLSSSAHFHNNHNHSHALPFIIRRNVFFESGVETNVDNPYLHFMHLGPWYTRSCDYYQHRRPAEGEVRSQVVVWLHNARPRNCFVFLIHGVENGTPDGTMFDKVKEFLYGAAPRFGIQGRATAKDGKKKRISGRPVGVEVIEVPHHFITAVDYSPGLVSSRFSLEVSQATCTWYESEEAARSVYCCSVADKTKANDAFFLSPNGAVVANFEEQQNAAMKMGNFIGNLPPLSERAENIMAATIGESGKKNISYENFSMNHNNSNNNTFNNKNSSRIRIQRKRKGSTQEGGEILVNEDENDDDCDSFEEGQSCDSVSVGSKETSASSALMTKKSFKLGGNSSSSASSNFKSKDHNTKNNSKIERGHAPSLTPLAIPASMVAAPSKWSEKSSNNTNNLLSHPSDSSVVFLSKRGDSNNIEPTATSTTPKSDNDAFLMETEPRIISNTMIVCYTQDPNFNAVLREIVLPGGSPTNEGLGSHDFTDSVSERQRLLRLVEAGIPSWAIFCTRYGIFYHRFLRIVVGWAVNLWPLIALALGLYDLYSHMPYVHQYLVPLFSLFEDSWIFRLSIGIAYVFSYFLYFFQGIFMYLSSAFSFLSFVVMPMYPVIEFFYPLYSFLYVVLISGASFVAQLFQLVFGSVGAILFGTLRAMFYPFVSILRLAPTTAATTGAAASTMPQFITWFVIFWSTVLRPLKNLGMAIYNNIIHAGSLIARHEASLRMWYMRKFRNLRKWIGFHAREYWRAYLGWLCVFAILYFGPNFIGYLFGVVSEEN